jgi:hypothetical protein
MSKVTTLLNVDQGSDFEQSWVWGTRPENSSIFSPNNLTGWTAQCQIRSTPTPTGNLLVPSVSVAIDGPAGKITLSIPGATSWPWKWSFGFYDVVLIAPTTLKRTQFADGQITLHPGVTNVV